jgi:hypothetical protein
MGKGLRDYSVFPIGQGADFAASLSEHLYEVWRCRLRHELCLSHKLYQ